MVTGQARSDICWFLHFLIHDVTSTKVLPLISTVEFLEEIQIDKNLWPSFQVIIEACLLEDEECHLVPSSAFLVPLFCNRIKDTETEVKSYV